MSNWFTIEHIDKGLDIMNIYNEVIKLTDKPILAVATHIHWDHINQKVNCVMEAVPMIMEIGRCGYKAEY